MVVQRTSSIRIAACVIALAACKSPAASTSPTAATPATLSRESLPFQHDDYPGALAKAKSSHKPLFVDAWAPWCHSCQSLRTFVLTDPKLAPLANDFVWLSVDTEKDVNAEWVAKYPHSALPTLWVIDPATDKPVLKWAGTVTADELKALLAVAISDTLTPGSATEAIAAFVRGNHAVAAGDLDLAEKEHRAALAAASADHPQRARIVEALVTQLSLRKRFESCAEVAAKEAPSLPVSTSRATTIVLGLGCAREHKDSAAIERLLPLAIEDAGRAELLPDDRSALYEEVVDTKRAAGDKAGALSVAKTWTETLEAAANKAPNADMRTSLDPLRLSAYLALGEPARAIPMLVASEKDFPSDYNPPARLGRIYLELSRLDEADKATDRAIARVYGPRVMRVLALKADIAKARGDRAAEIAALEQALSRSEKAVLTEGQKSVREGLVKRLAALR